MSACENGKIILALDASSTNVGWCLGQGERYLNSGVYRPRGDADQRVHAIVRWLDGMIETHDPDWIGVENPVGHHHNLKTDRLLARVCGNIEGVCIVSGLPVAWVHAMTVKATGFSKDNPAIVANLIDKPSIGPDEADAVGVWLAMLGMEQSQRFMNLISQEVQQ